MAADVIRIIGIDFGTSTSVVCVKRYKDGEPVGDAFLSSSVTFGNGQGDTRAHTLVRRNGNGTYTCGREAADEAPDSEIFREFKMDLESPDEAKRTQARTLTEEFFKYLYRWYDHQRSDMGDAGDQEKTIVSFPAKWSEGTRAFMAEAAKKAGFPDVSVMDEPSAALYATLTRKMNDVSDNGFLRTGKPGYMLLIDMGAGTTDLAVCRYTVTAGDGDVIRAEQIKNELVSTWPESGSAPTFGGREVDRLLESYLTDYMVSCGLTEDMARQLVCRSDSVKSWKEETVSARLNEGAVVDSCGFLSGYMMLLPQKQPFPSIDRAKLEGLLGEKLEGFKSLITGCLDRACALEPAIQEQGLDLVVLTGGHSAWYFTEALLNGSMPGVSHPALKRARAEKARVMRLSNPQETVALGLVYSLLPLRQAGEEQPQPEEEPQVEEPPQPVQPPQPKNTYKCTVTVTRKRQFYGAALKMFISVDGGTEHRLTLGESCSFSVSSGSHTFTCCLKNSKNARTESIEIDVDRDMNLLTDIGGPPAFAICFQDGDKIWGAAYDQYAVRLTRKAQVLGITSKMIVTVDDDQTFELAPGDLCLFSVRAGTHTLCFSGTGSNSARYRTDFRVDHHMELICEVAKIDQAYGIKVKEGPKIVGIAKPV